jgi:drug/metabolite transporter (DMT)-like permease
MSQSSDIYSVDSSILNDEMLAEKRKNERFAYIVGILSQFIWALNSIQLKTYKHFFPKDFSNNSLVFWRSLPIWLLGYYLCKLKNIRIKPFNSIKHKFWFLMRSFGNYFIIFLWIQILNYLRVSTGQVISGCFPVLVIFLSIPILHEKFYFRYIIGVLICIFGSGIIIMNERNPEAAKTQLNNNVTLGVFFALCHLVFYALNNLSQKILCKENLSPDEQNYYLGLYNTLPALICMIFENHYGFSSFVYIIYSISNGFIFYLGNYLTALALENISINKFLPMTYMNIVFVFILGFLFLGENVYFTDIFGSMLIMGFQVYNVAIPCGKVVDPNKIKSNNQNVQK